MFYRATIVIATTSRPPVDKVKAELKKLWHLAQTINPGTDHAEPSSIRLEQCFHDLDPAMPCTELFYLETPIGD